MRMEILSLLVGFFVPVLILVYGLVLASRATKALEQIADGVSAMVRREGALPPGDDPVP